MKHCTVQRKRRGPGNAAYRSRVLAAGWKQGRWLFLLTLLTLMGNSLYAQVDCQIMCNDQDEDVPAVVAVDASCMITITAADRIDADNTDCDGTKNLSVRDDQNNLLGEGPDEVIIDAQPYLGQVLSVTVTDEASGFFCVSFIQPEDLSSPILNCDDLDISCSQDTSAMALGMPVVDENCSGLASLTYVDMITEEDCASENAAIIRRTWTAVGNNGNTGTCTQTIAVKRPQVQDIKYPANITLSCEDPDTDPGNTGFPAIDGQPVTNEGFCGLTVGYKDVKSDLCGGNNYQITRTWSITDDCTDITYTQDQIIQIKDDVPPVITCPDNIVVPTLPGKCFATVTLPKPMITDNCDSDPVPIVKTSFGGVGFGPHELVFVGTYTVQYTAMDACGNTSTCQITLTVVDVDEPTAVCDEFTIASVPTSGYARVSASTFDNGSYDNCKPRVFFKARRQTIGACTNVNGDDSPEDGYQEWFDDYVIFCCEEVGVKDIKVILKVYEIDPGAGPVDPARELPGGDLYGHYNECLVSINIQDEKAPAMTCPGDVTVECGDDYFDLSAFGSPIVTERCGFTLDSIETKELASCGEGTITRTWTATDLQGNASICTQTISIVNNARLQEEQITWPKDYEVMECGAALDPDNLPEGFNRPVIAQGLCDLAGVNYEDQFYDVNYPGCYEILRKWTIVDLCNYDPAFPELGGRFMRVQKIRVSDNVAPTLKIPRDTTVNLTGSCDEVVLKLLPAVAQDDCSRQVVIENTSPYAADNGADASGTYPLGTTEVVFTATDRCGNSVKAKMTVTVVDKKSPAPICITGLSANLSQMDQGIMAMVDVIAFDGGTTDACGSEIIRSIRRSGSGLKTAPPPDSTILTFDCDDIGPQLVEFWVTDENGNSDFCETFILIQDNNLLCAPVDEPEPEEDPEPPVATGSIAGDIITEEGETVEEVKVELSSSNPLLAYTGVDGFFRIIGVPLGYDYSLKPYRTNGVLNGVTTLDLVLISKHILGVSRLDSPYRIIAADVDRSGRVSTLDMVKLRKLILNATRDLPNGNTSWRFVDARYEFPDPANPFLEEFPEIYNLNNFQEDEMLANFVAIKIGDVNNTAAPNSLVTVDPRGRAGTLELQVDEREVRAGEVFTVEVRAAAAQTIAGYQFTMDFDSRSLQFEGLTAGDLPEMSDDNFGFTTLNEGFLPTSWNIAGKYEVGAGTVLFHLTFTARDDIRLSEALTISSRIAAAEAYDPEGQLLDVQLQFRDEQGKALAGNRYQLFQNTPNPFRNETVIGFNLPEGGAATLTVYDLAGKLIYRQNGNFSRGYNQVVIKGSDLPQAGMLYYQLEAGEFTATRRMILMR